MLPALHNLGIGAVAEPPRTRARRKAQLERNVKAVDEAKPRSRRPRTVLPNRGRSAPPDDAAAKERRDGYREPCLEHDPGTPFDRVITQEQAARWFDAGRFVGKGSFGEAKAYRVPETELRGNPFVVIKRFFNPANAAKEARAHMRIWRRSDDHCRKYISTPACMEWPTVPAKNTYAVQTLVGPVGSRTQTHTWHKTVTVYGWVLRQLTPDVKEMICRQLGDMMGCFAKTRMLHGDLHAENLMVTHNLGWLDFKDRTDMLLRVRFQFCAVDWGSAYYLSEESFDDNGVPKTICPHDDWTARHNPNASADDDLLQRSWRLMFGIRDYSDRWAAGSHCVGEKWGGLYVLLVGLFFPNALDQDLPRDSVTRAQLVEWVREAYVEALGVEYPPEERKKMEDVIKDERFRYKDDRVYQL